jgi:single-strand DNA-binding protein
MNKVILMGRLTRDPEVRYSQGASQTAVARFSIAVDRRFKREGEPDADFFNCTCFGKQAEFVERYLHKGTKIVTSGRIQNDNYTNKEGQMVYSVRVMVDEIEFAESKNAGNAGDNSYAGGGYAGGSNSGSAPAASGAGDGFMNIPDGIDEELPFN